MLEKAASVPLPDDSADDFPVDLERDSAQEEQVPEVAVQVDEVPGSARSLPDETPPPRNPTPPPRNSTPPPSAPSPPLREPTPFPHREPTPPPREPTPPPRGPTPPPYREPTPPISRAPSPPPRRKTPKIPAIPSVPMLSYSTTPTYRPAQRAGQDGPMVNFVEAPTFRPAQREDPAYYSWPRSEAQQGSRPFIHPPSPPKTFPQRSTSLDPPASASRSRAEGLRDDWTAMQKIWSLRGRRWRTRRVSGEGWGRQVSDKTGLSEVGE